MDVLRAIIDKRPVLQNFSECWSRFLMQYFWKENVKIRASKLVCILKCDMKDTACRCRVKFDRYIVKEFGVQGFQEKDRRCMYD